MKNILRKMMFYLKFPFYVIHILLYLTSANKKTIDKDVSINNKWRRCNSFTGIKALVFLIETDKFFRTLFYVRIGVASVIIRWLIRGDDSFSPNNRIGGGVLLFHPYSTVLNARKIGENLVIHQCVTIGNKSDILEDACPCIGDNVIIGANACVIGDINIGDNAIIGAGAVVVKDVPKNAVVVGNPARIVKYIENNK